MAATSPIRSDSSASSLQTPTSPIPSSVEAQGGGSASLGSRMQMSEKTNGHVEGASSSSRTRPHEEGKRSARQQSFARARSASLQKGVAVLKALARAPEPASDDDSGYEDEAGEDVGAVPGEKKRRGSNKKEEDEAATIKLTEEEKESGRANREGLRRRNEDKEVERLVGHRTHSSTSIDSSTGKKKEKKKQVWITEKPRKIFHGSIAFLVLYMYLWYIDLHTIVRNLSIFLGIVITADVLRLNIPAFETIYEMVLGFLMRESEKTKVNGVVWYLVGVITCLSFFPSDIACVAVMILSWADTAASIFGRLFGSKTPSLPSPPFASRKSTAGFVAAVIVASITAAVFWATPIAQIGLRSEGLSIYDSYGRGVFGTAHAAGPLGSGWTGFQWGFRPSHPDDFTSRGSKAAARTFIEAIKMAPRSVFSGPPQDRPIPMPLLCIGSGLVAGIAEALELGGVDDNLSLPILSAIGIQFLLVSWGWFARLTA